MAIMFILDRRDVSLTTSIAETQVLQCPGVAPVMDDTPTPCEDGYWVLNQTISLNASNYNIEGRIQILGDFTLPIGASLSWKGFLKTEDSHPEFQTQGDFILSHVNVTGNLTILGDIHVDISPENLEKLIGPVDTSQPQKRVAQPITESDNTPTITLLASTAPTQNCRKVAVSTESSVSNGRSTLSAVFSIDDSGCKKKKTNVAAIVAPIVCVCVLIIVVIVVVLATKSEMVKSFFRPFHKRKLADRNSVMVVRESVEMEDVGQPGDIESLGSEDLDVST